MSLVDEIPDPATKFTGWAKIVTVGGVVTFLCCLLAYIITWYLPNESDKHRDSIERQQGLFSEQMEKQRQMSADHGKEVAKDITETIKEQTKEQQRNSALSQLNQELVIEEQRKAARALLKIAEDQSRSDREELP